MKRILSLSLLILTGLFLWAQLPNVWINEFHYDNSGTDSNEGIEIVFEEPVAFVLDDLNLTLYNGSNGAPYGSVSFASFVPGDRIGSFVVFYRRFNGIQNGSPDGFSLDYRGVLLQFLSYEGSFLATAGPAAGMVSVDAGVAETGSTAEDESLQLSGDGRVYADFAWNVPARASFGSFNPGQYIDGQALPTVMVAPDECSLMYETGYGPCSGEAFTVWGYHLGGAVVLSPSEHLELSADNISYNSLPLIVNPTGGVLDPILLFVRLKAGLPVADYPESVSIESDGASDRILYCTGSVIPVLPDLVINEILADPGAENGDANADGVVHSSNDEFVEIVHNGSAPLNLAGFTLSDALGVKHIFCSFVLNPGEAVVVFGGGMPTGIPGFVMKASSGSLGLNNGGDGVFLRDPYHHVVDSYVYGSEGGNDQSLTRDPDLTGLFVGHSLAFGSGGSPFSPGTHIDGEPFAGPGPPVPLNRIGFALVFFVSGLLRFVGFRFKK